MECKYLKYIGLLIVKVSRLTCKNNIVNPNKKYLNVIKLFGFDYII
jgi:hypothetical protein